MELATLLQRSNRSIVASGTEADERMTEGELIYINEPEGSKVMCGAKVRYDCNIG